MLVVVSDVTRIRGAWLRLAVIAKRWARVESDLGPVIMSDDVGPAVLGILEPRIVLPRWLIEAPGSARRVVMAALMRDGRARAVLLNSPGVTFYAPRHLFVEIASHMPDIVKTSGVPKATVDALLHVVTNTITLIPEAVTSPFLPAAGRLAKAASAEGDEEYIALALALETGIWSYDADFDRVAGIRRIGTSEVAATP